MMRLLPYCPAESLFTSGDRIWLTIEVVGADTEAPPAGHRQNPLQRLRSDFNQLKLSLLLSASAIRFVPVTEIRQQAPLNAGNAPVRDFMQGRFVKPVSKNQPVVRTPFISRQIFRLMSARYQACVFTVGKQPIKQSDDISREQLRQGLSGKR